jgi:U3 small nucleolar RNA-associated protein 14
LVQAKAEEEEFRRAQERLTLKHRNTSRWARRVLKRGLSLATQGQHDALHDQLRLGQALRAKAASIHDERDSGNASDSRYAANPHIC